MNCKRAFFGLTAFALIACAPGCSSSQDDEGDGDEGALTESTPGQWVVDLAKVNAPWDRGGYGRSTQVFFGLGPQEYGLCKQGEAPEQCAAKPILWDQTFRFGPQVREGSVEFRKPYANDKSNPVVKLADGRVTGPKGKGLNIIPLLKNTDPTAQVHLRKWMKNGDVVTFFHPEYNSMRQLMDRRVSHVAMHYDYKSPHTGREYVHHFDNPNNYGPRYNYPPSRNMPFHVFRYQPKGMDVKMAAAYAHAARNWAFMDDDLSPFADFFDLQSQTTRDLQTKFVTPLLRGESIARVYCSGLAWTNLNLGVNHPLKPGMVTQDYTRAETGETFKASDCADPASEKCVLTPAKLGDVEAASLQGRGKLVFSPYTTTDLATAWLDNTWGELPPEKRAEIAKKPETQQQIAQGLNALRWSDADGKAALDANQQPVSVSVSSAENLKAWADGYGATLDYAKAMKEGNREVAAAIVRSFIESHQLKLKDGRVASMTELIKMHNGSRPADADPDKWITVDVLTMTPSQILRALEMAHVDNRFVPPRIWLDQADDVTFLPGGADPRQDSKSDMVYVGTVINCELLSASDGSGADACAVEGEGVGGGMDEFSEGGADTSTYPHYAVPNGGERTHRRFDASPGPALMGKGTKILARATTYEMSDVKFLLHTPELYGEGYTEFVNTLFANVPADVLAAEARQRGLAGMSVRDYDTACTAMSKVAASQNGRGSCAPKRAIVLDVAKANEVVAGDARARASGAIPDAIYSFELGNVCRIASPDAEKMTCQVVSQKPDGSGWDFEHVQEVDVSRSTRGNFALTMVDEGRAPSTPPAIDPANPNAARDERAYGLCNACSAQGSHFNQWTLTIRNDRQ